MVQLHDSTFHNSLVERQNRKHVTRHLPFTVFYTINFSQLLTCLLQCFPIVFFGNQWDFLKGHGSQSENTSLKRIYFEEMQIEIQIFHESEDRKPLPPSKNLLFSYDELPTSIHFKITASRRISVQI